LNKIISDVNKIEEIRLSVFIKSAKSQIVTKKQTIESEEYVKMLNNKLNSIKDPLFYQVTINAIKEHTDKILTQKLTLVQLNSQFSPENLMYINTLGDTLTTNSPIYPKKYLVIFISLISVFLFSVF